MAKPKTGEEFICKECGMAIKVTAECKCKEGAPKLECCGKPLVKK